MGYIEAICRSRKKGVIKRPVLVAEFIEAWGIKGDAHAGSWHRQISMLQRESIDLFRERIPWIKNGVFAENIITRNMDLSSLNIGDGLILNNDVVLEITQIGKECHNSCSIKKVTGDCIMPKFGIFAKVIKGGIVRPGDSIKIFKSHKISA